MGPDFHDGGKDLPGPLDHSSGAGASLRRKQARRLLAPEERRAGSAEL